VRLTDDALFGCPYLMASDVGTIGLTDMEAARLRLYLEKGGFMWVDDFWGDAAWEQWEREFAKVMPPPDYVIEDVPLSDPIFHSMFEVKRVPQVSNIRFWRIDRRREYLGARRRICRRALPRRSRQASPHRCGDDAQHGHLGFVGAGRRRSALLPAVRAGRLRARDQCRAVCADSLAPEGFRSQVSGVVQVSG
jgi:hypothetical protein